MPTVPETRFAHAGRVDIAYGIPDRWHHPSVRLRPRRPRLERIRRRAQDGVAVATDLHTLLQREGEHGPYVLAGHSAGGLYILNFVHLYRDQVAGVALLDSMSAQQYTQIADWPMFYEMFLRASPCSRRCLVSASAA